MDIRPLDTDTALDWQAIASTSAESWFWHTPQWLAFVKAIGADFFIADLSSVFYVDGAPAAICPVILEERGGYRRFTYLGEFIPYPAFAPALAPPIQARVLADYSTWLEELARLHDVAYTRVMLPTLSEAATGAAPAAWNPLLRHGYGEISLASQVIALGRDSAELWREVRKGHRSDIKRAAAHCTVAIWDRHTITDAKFDEYRMLHALDAGRVTRAPETFDMMLSWVREGHAVLVEASQDGAAIAFALIILFRSGAYYASSCKHPSSELPTMHLLQWRAIEWMKAQGVAFYDIGMQYFGPSWTVVPSPKDVSIASFKRGFGGDTRRIDVVERFYSTAVMEQVYTARLRALADAREPQAR